MAVRRVSRRSFEYKEGCSLHPAMVVATQRGLERLDVRLGQECGYSDRLVVQIGEDLFLRSSNLRQSRRHAPKGVEKGVASTALHQAVEVAMKHDLDAVLIRRQGGGQTASALQAEPQTMKPKGQAITDGRGIQLKGDVAAERRAFDKTRACQPGEGLAHRRGRQTQALRLLHDHNRSSRAIETLLNAQPQAAKGLMEWIAAAGQNNISPRIK